ncbi:DUF5410 domain-containing protein [Rickettsia prowazekii]|uniref:Uncharacterized protein RP364 n=2 Tax=Rickettsia prowazekii TaxID=782 RepID=Y364_RICPR|nr:DUF5410 domain-containing protein [Rickettsia prowazekii]Q9ZDG5.1 RecName: Full=Uncharacterized protein RP364 [Rickettsia prowazekii str. Madrid E]ADE29885.1 hypothetical protein rpr22_CDS356 [Rickettsia prowazekii str. Rp22]AFE49179.1 hypothetical protein M9W_01770 [Rickettsia prowazekii str. Chernikova]AFE50025.1 hypothetical protein M9Y_01775 [Rickettsia prowazekii str. Katsinyian]AFE50870.1 hypothetical protein MA1_01770 [Rickettsia prowazekii str. BuV67-CWPP]AFE51707.1 hypothetical pr
MATKNKKEIVNTETKNLANLIIKEISKESFDFGILQKMQQAFSTASKQKQREAFINILDTKLDKEQLHKLNQTIMKNANELMPDNDPNFVCRTSNNKVFQEILLLEAKRSGMQARFSDTGALQSLDIKDITPEILDHYRVLQEKFYLKRNSKDSVDSRIAQSINFLLYAPLFRESDIYKKLGLKSAEIEREIQDPNGKYVQQLIDAKIGSNIPFHMQKNNVNEGKEIERTAIIEKAITKFEQDKKFSFEGKKRDEITKYLSKSLEGASDYILTFKKNELVDVIYQGLDKGQTLWSKVANYIGIKSYSISKENLKSVAKIINDKIKSSHTPLKIEVQDKLKQISKELNRLNNPVLPSEAQKVQVKSNKKPPIAPKPEHLKKRDHGLC